MQKSYIKRFESFKKSFANLSKAKDEDVSNVFILSGIIMIFNITFDLAWKLLREVLKEEFGIIDFPSGSPKETLKKTANVGLISDENWFDMLLDRNDLTHDYDYELAKEKYNKIINNYIPIFESLKNKINSFL